MLQRCLILGLIIGCWFTSHAQSYMNYSEKDGLPSNHVYKITQDTQGYIWIATDEGLVKYNGTSFTTFTTKEGLPTNDIYNVFPARDGKLWYIAKSSSLGYIKNDSVYNFHNSVKDEVMDAIFTSFDGNSIIPTSGERSYTLNQQQKWEQVPYDSIPDHHLVAYLKHHTYKGPITHNYKGDVPLKLIDHDGEIYDLKETFNFSKSSFRGQVSDSLYFISTKNSYTAINLNSTSYKRYYFNDVLNIPEIQHLRIHLSNNNIQLTGAQVVSQLNKSLQPEVIYHIPKELNSHFSYIDKENTVWIATFSNGIYKYVPNNNSITTSYKNTKVFDIKRVNNKIMALFNNKGIYEYQHSIGDFKAYLNTQNFIYDAAYIPELNTYYFPTRSDLYFQHESDQQARHNNDNNEELVRSISYHKKALYGYFTTGVNKLDPKTLEVPSHYQLLGARCQTVFKDQLIAGHSNGMVEITENEVHQIPSLIEFKKPVIDLVTINDEQLVVCTSGFGVYITDLKEISLLKETKHLKANNPLFVDNQLFIPTNKGLYHYQYSYKQFTLQQVLTIENGLPTNKINGVEKIDDELLIATNQGVVHFPIDYQPSQSLIDISISKINYGNHNLFTNNKVLFSEKNDLQVIIDHIDFRDHNALEYEYRLLTGQTQWVKTNSPNIRFTDLRPDDYILEIKNGSIQKKFFFTILPRWYQTWWFYSMCIIGLIGSVVWVTWYISHLATKRRNKEIIQSQQLSELQLRALRSQMNPHFVFNSLTAIQYYINENDFETSDTYLVKFSRLIREFFELSKEEEISIKREIKLLNNYLELEKLRFKTKFDYDIIVDPTLDHNNTLPTMILQPIVENAVNHGIFNRKNEGKVSVHFVKKSQAAIEIIISDNGPGYDFSKNDKRYKSSSVLEQRLRFLKNAGHWEIELNRSSLSPNSTYPGHVVSIHLKKINL